MSAALPRPLRADTSFCRASALLILSLSAALPACAPTESHFPEGFLFGVATAGFQNDPGCPTLPESECTDHSSDWYQFVTAPELRASARSHLSGDPLSMAPGSYELFEQDFDLVKDRLRGNAVRLSLEWSRIFPRSTAGTEDFAALRALADPVALRHYHQVFAALKQRELHPLVTLNHYTLPSWRHDTVGCHKDLATCTRRGWLDAETVRELAKYAGFCAREFGAEVDLWATLNEPFAVILPGYIAPSDERSNPPAVLLAMAEARAVMLAMIEAHARMYDAVKQADHADADGDGQSAQVGLVYNLTPAAPRDPQNPRDVAGAKNLFYLYNEAFLNGVLHGDVDPLLDGHTEHHADLERRMDYLGINYYTRTIVDGTDRPFLPDLSPLSTFNPLTTTLFTEYPNGMAEMVAYVNRHGVPAIITENGTMDSQSPESGARYLTQHLASLQQAAAAGADVRGYFYWTLVDNYEWNHGMQIRMGLFELLQDAHKTRKPRPIVEIFRQIAERNGVLPELLSQYPLPQDSAAP